MHENVTRRQGLEGVVPPLRPAESDAIGNAEARREFDQFWTLGTIAHNPVFRVRETGRSERSEAEVKAFPVEQPPHADETDCTAPSDRNRAKTRVRGGVHTHRAEEFHPFRTEPEQAGLCFFRHGEGQRCPSCGLTSERADEIRKLLASRSAKPPR